MASTLSANNDALADRRRRARAHASAGNRIANRIPRSEGSVTFVSNQPALFGGYVLADSELAPGLRAWGPSFVVLAVAASVEAIFLSTLILISQNGMAAAADKRDLDLHVTLLTEHELTKLAQLVQ